MYIAILTASLSLTISQSLPKFMSIALLMPSSHLILWCPLLLLPSIFSSIRDFSYESAVHIKWPEYWSFSFSISPSDEYSGLISLKIDWFDLLAVQGTFKSLLQQHNSKASILWCFTFFMIQLSQSYVTTKKTIALTIQTFARRVMSLLFNVFFRFVIAVLQRSNLLLISWLQSPSTVILKPPKRKSVTTFSFSSSIGHVAMGPYAMILDFFNIQSQLFHSPPLPSSRGSLFLLHFLSLEWYHLHIWGCRCFSCLSGFQLVTQPAQHFL